MNDAELNNLSSSANAQRERELAEYHTLMDRIYKLNTIVRETPAALQKPTKRGIFFPTFHCPKCGNQLASIQHWVCGYYLRCHIDDYEYLWIY